MRNDTNLTMAEDEIRNQNMEILSQAIVKPESRSLRSQFSKELNNMKQQSKQLRLQLKEVGIT